MLDIGWQELLVIGALALIVVGPKDLPTLLRSCGQWVGKIRGMAREFQRTMDQAAREADVANLKELRDLKNDIGSFDLTKQAYKAVTSDEAAAKVKKPETTAAPAEPDDPGMVDDTASEPAPAPIKASDPEPAEATAQATDK